MYSYGPPHMAVQKQDEQLELTYSNYVRTQDVSLKTCRRRWVIGRSGERGSGISMLTARHDDDDDYSFNLLKQNLEYVSLNGFEKVKICHCLFFGFYFLFLFFAFCFCFFVFVFVWWGYILIFSSFWDYNDDFIEWLLSGCLTSFQTKNYVSVTCYFNGFRLPIYTLIVYNCEWNTITHKYTDTHIDTHTHTYIHTHTHTHTYIYIVRKRDRETERKRDLYHLIFNDSVHFLYIRWIYTLIVYPIYQPLRSGRIWHKVNF